LRYESPWALWQDLEGEEYRMEKEQIEKDATACLELLIPAFQASIELLMLPLQRPMSVYTGVRNGAYEGFMPTKENIMKS
jgi:hypothetical protein